MSHGQKTDQNYQTLPILHRVKRDYIQNKNFVNMAPKKNGFFFFMLEVQKRETEKGVSCTRAAAQKLADPLWRELSQDLKVKYNNMAKKHNNTDDKDLSKKFTSLGVSFATIENEERSKEEALTIMSSNISTLISSLHKNNKLKTHNFFVAHVNYYYKTDVNDINSESYFAPAEFALAVFSFELGRIDLLHFFIDIGKIPLGYSYAAREWSERVHQIPPFDTPKGTLNNYSVIYNKVMNFIKKYSPDEVPPIYTMCDALNLNYSHSSVQWAFNNMCDNKKLDRSLFRVYHLDKLFYEVIHVCRPNQTFLSTALMRAEIEKDTFSYAKDLGCHFHEALDTSINCSLSMVIRWIYTMCDHCCKDLKIKLKVGYHVPQDVDVNWRKTMADDYEEKASQHQPDSNLSFILPEDGARGGCDEDYYDSQSEICESVRPKYSSKIGANFCTGSTTSLVPETTSDEGEGEAQDSDWTVVDVSRKYGLGRGKKIPQANKLPPMLPMSGRGRLFAGLKQ